VIDLGDFIHPRVEPEICFLTSRVIDRPLSMLEAGNYLAAVAPAMEIIDSRYRNFKFTLEDVVADNCSSAALVVGAFSEQPEDLRNLINRGVAMRYNGHAVQLGSTGAILGNPLRSIVQASQLLTPCRNGITGRLVDHGGCGHRSRRVASRSACQYRHRRSGPG